MSGDLLCSRRPAHLCLNRGPKSILFMLMPLHLICLWQAFLMCISQLLFYLQCYLFCYCNYMRVKPVLSNFCALLVATSFCSPCPIFFLYHLLLFYFSFDAPFFWTLCHICHWYFFLTFVCHSLYLFLCTLILVSYSVPYPSSYFTSPPYGFIIQFFFSPSFCITFSPSTCSYIPLRSSKPRFTIVYISIHIDHSLQSSS